MSYYDLPVAFRSIETWPGERTKLRKCARFRAPWTKTLAQLKRELKHLGAKDIVLELDMDESQIRRDGYPRSDARQRGPGVILSLSSKFGALRYPCDAYTNWEDNTRAIALALEALRKVDRYGVTKRGEQYTGWKKLPPAGGTTATMDTHAAAAFMAAASGLLPVELLKNPALMRSAYIASAKKMHPDNGGSAREFAVLGEAKRALEAHHGNGAP